MMKWSYLEFAQKFPLDVSQFDYWSVANEAATAFKKDVELINGNTWEESFPDLFSSEVSSIVNDTESILNSNFYVKHLGVNQRIGAIIHLIDHDTNNLYETSLLELEEYILQRKMYYLLFQLIANLCETDMSYMVKHIDKFFNDLPEDFRERTITLQVEAFKNEIE